MKINSEFYNDQYKENNKNLDSVLDHNWYRYLLKYAIWRVDIVWKYILNSWKQYNYCIELWCGNWLLYRIIKNNINNYIWMDISDYNLAQFLEQDTDLEKWNLIKKDLNEKLSEIKTISQDLVISIGTIEYLFDPYSFVAESNRILKSWGEFILHTMNIAFLPRRLQLFFWKLPTFNNTSGWQWWVLHNFTYSTLKKLLEENWFEIKGFYCSWIFPKFRTWLPWLLCGDLIFVCTKK